MTTTDITHHGLLFEIGCEELPPAAVLSLSHALADAVAAELTQARLDFGTIRSFAAPRRLAIHIQDLASRQQQQVNERRGPAVALAFDSEGSPTMASLSFAKSCGVHVDELSRHTTDKGSWLAHQHVLPGLALAEVLPGLLSNALAKLPIRKPMRWGNHSFSFVRPVHWLVLLYGNDVIAGELLGQTTGRLTYGHRFHHPAAIELPNDHSYETLLANTGHVIADFSQRRDLIKQQIHALAAQKHAQLQLVDDDALLDQVTAMVESPYSLCASFSPSYLQVPAEALISAIREHQNCFHLLDQQGKLLPFFIAVSNINSLQPQQVVVGNERVMRARLADAMFFYQQDCAQRMDDWVEQLGHIVFQQRLGSVQAKTQRLASLAQYLGHAFAEKDLDALHRAAILCKADLVSQMVGEFPELQGIMGQYYARQQGETNAVAEAIREHYLPRFANDVLPCSNIGVILALADRLDTLLGIFAAGLKPTGDKDPFALRRSAIAIVRLLVDKRLSLALDQVLTFAARLLHDRLPGAEKHVSEVHTFIVERCSQWLKDQGGRDDAIKAVLAVGDNDLADANARLKALTVFLATTSAASLAAANKRISNLLTKDAASTNNKQATINSTLLRETAEIRLADCLTLVQQTVAPLLAKRQYTELLHALAELQAPIDLFFDQVMVLVEDPALRQNRLALVQQLRQLFLCVADFSLLRLE